MTEHKTKITRRGLLRAGAALAAAGTLATPQLARAQARELRVLIAGGTWRDFFHEVFAGPFARMKNCEITYRLGLTFEPMIMAQRRNPQWDVIHQNQNRSTALGTMGVLRPWTPDRIPNMARVHESFKYEYNVGKTHTPYGLCVNTRRITRPINSWMDMWDPAFRGKVGYPAWGWVGDEVFHTINQVLGGNAENVDPGINKMKELFQANQAKVTNNVEHTRQLLAAEEIWITPFFSARVDQAREAGIPVEFVIPNEGGLSWIYNTTLIAGRPAGSMQLADEFVNFTLDPQKQIEFARKTGYPPTHLDAINNLPADLARLRLTDAQIQAYGRLQRQFDYLAQFAYRDQHIERWNREVLAGT